MIRAAFFGSSTVAGKDLPNFASRFSSIVSRILGWHEINLGLADTHAAGRDNEGRIISALSGIARTQEVVRAKPDIVIVLFGEEDFADSILIDSRISGRVSATVASIPAATQDRRTAGITSDSLNPLAAPFGLDGMHPAENGVQPAATVRLPGPGTFDGDFDAIVGELAAAVGPGKVCVVTPPYRSDASVPNAASLTLADYRNAVTSIGTVHEVRVLDAFQNSTIQPANYSQLTIDGTHLNEAGHERLAAFLIESLL